MSGSLLMRRRLVGGLAAMAAAALLAGCGGSHGSDTSSSDISKGSAPSQDDTSHDRAMTTAARARVVGPTLVAVGDIACPAGIPRTTTTCRQDSTAIVARAINPTYVLTLGDEQYQNGSLAEFRGGYDLSWGAVKSKTKPLPGNHEYNTAGAAGYYTYFGQQPPGYYAFDVNGWRVYMLNSNCTKINCTLEAMWLVRDMNAHPRACSLIAMHHPRYSSGLEHGSSTDPQVRLMWRVAYGRHADVALAGHDHDYERFARMNGDFGVRRSSGILSYVVGTGGRNLYHPGRKRYGSEYFQHTNTGVLKLVLGSGAWAWDFRATSGRSLDAGSRSCV